MKIGIEGNDDTALFACYIQQFGVSSSRGAYITDMDSIHADLPEYLCAERGSP